MFLDYYNFEVSRDGAVIDRPCYQAADEETAYQRAYTEVQGSNYDDLRLVEIEPAI